MVANSIIGFHPTITRLGLALSLAETPVGIHGAPYRFPDIALREPIATFAHRASGTKNDLDP